ncbi:hypothetical protein FB451DRAFT_1560946 [Mycena latifolia]|nr:hypothetical protein FB451DRAFT_1560946 [Mycena latifolia]
MSDPITITTTVITLASIIKDLIDVGQNIRCSIAKVGENRRRVQELTDDMLRTLADLATLTRRHEYAFHKPELLSALGNLKEDMYSVLVQSRRFVPDERPGFHRLKCQIKGWLKRDHVEAEIRRLKEHVNKCYLHFMVFSAARIEHTSLRVEQVLIINNVENQVKLRRLEGMMARVLLETQFGQSVMNETVKVISSDPMHESLESRYLSMQTLRLINSLQNSMACSDFVLDEALWDSVEMMFLQPASISDVVHLIIGKALKLNGGPTRTFQPEEVMEVIQLDLSAHLTYLGMVSESTAWALLEVQILRRYVKSPGPWLADVLDTLASCYGAQLRHELALQASQQSLDLCRFHSETSPEADSRPLFVTSLLTHSHNLLQAGQSKAAIAIAREAVGVCRPMVTQMNEPGSGLPPWTEQEYRAIKSCDAFFALGAALSSAGRHIEAYEASKEGFNTLLIFSGFLRPHSGTELNIHAFLNQLCSMAEQERYSLSLLGDDVILFRDLTRIYPKKFSSQFLRLLYAYAYLF